MKAEKLNSESSFQKEIEKILAPLKIFLTTHHENTKWVDYETFCWLKIAQNLEASLWDKENTQMMISYREAMEWNNTWGIPEVDIKFNNKKQSITQHFIHLLKEHIKNPHNTEGTLDKFNKIFEKVFWFWQKIKVKGERKQVKIDKSNSLYENIRQKILNLDKKIKVEIWIFIISWFNNTSWNQKEYTYEEYIKLAENDLIKKEYIRKWQSYRRIFDNAILDIRLHLKDIKKFWESIHDISDQEIKSIVLASFQNGVQTEWWNLYDQIWALHKTFWKTVYNPFSKDDIKWKEKTIYHIPLSSYTELPKSLWLFWEYVWSHKDYWDDFIEHVIEKSLQKTSKDSIQLWYARYYWKKVSVSATNINWKLSWNLWKKTNIDRETWITLIKNTNQDKSRMLVYQNVLQFVPICLGKTYHIWSERWAKSAVGEILLDRHNKKWTSPEFNIIETINNHIIVWDKPTPGSISISKDWILSYIKTVKKLPVAIEWAAPHLEEIVLNCYPIQLINAIIENPNMYHIPNQIEKDKRLINNILWNSFTFSSK